MKFGPDPVSCSSYSDGETDSVTVDDSGGDSETDAEVDTVTLGAGGAVSGGSQSSSLAQNGVSSTVTTTETDTEENANSSTESSSEGGESDSDSLTSGESDTDTSTETDIDSSSGTDTSTMVLGAAGVALSGNAFELDDDTDTSSEDDSDTGSDSSQEVDIDTDDVGGNITSESESTSEADSNSSTDSDGGTDWSTSTENTTYGAGGIVSGGNQSDTTSDTDSSTQTDSDSSNGSSVESSVESQAEAADSSNETVNATGTDDGTDSETDTDSGSSGELESLVLGAAGDVQSGLSTSSDTDTGGDTESDTDASTDTTTETDSTNETVGGETDTDQSTDTSTETDGVTDTSTDAPTNTEESSQTYGVGQIVLSGTGTTSLTDTDTGGQTTTDVDIDTSKETHSDWISGDSATTLNDNTQTTATETTTLTGTDSSTDDDNDWSSDDLGVSGQIVGGEDQDIETGSDSGSGGTTGGGTSTFTTTHTDLESSTGSSVAESTSQTGTEVDSSAGSTSETSSESDSMTDDEGDGGEVTDGESTQTLSSTDGATDSTTETITESGSTSETTSNEVGVDSITDHEAGTNTLASTDTTSSDYTGTLTEDLGEEGTVSDGDECDSLSNSSEDTSTETDADSETVTDSALAMTRTLADASTDSDTDNECDRDWASEALGSSATIASGSDCFTVNNLDTSSRTSSGSGPENYSDTAYDPDGTANESGSGASSQLTHQVFGDVLGAGGVIASGSLSYTVSSSDTDAESTTDSGTETLADEEGGGPNQTASYSTTESTPDDDTAYETGTETLGSGGTISGGTASFSWSIGNSLNRNLGVSGIAATLNITESTTDSYGFAESGTETITSGGADEPGCVSFAWNQMGTDNYQILQGNTIATTAAGESSLASYSLNMTDTVSSSWHDTGVDELTDDDEVVGETDTYSWADLNSVTDNLTETLAISPSTITMQTETYSGYGLDSFSLTDSGTETLEWDESGESWSLGGESDRFAIDNSVANGTQDWDSGSEDLVSTNSMSGTTSGSVANGYSFHDVGNDSLYGTASDTSDSYTLSNSYSVNDSSEIAGSGIGGTSDGTSNIELFDLLQVEGTDSYGPGDYDNSTMAFDEAETVDGSYSGSASLIVGDSFLQGVFTVSSHESFNSLGTSTESDGYAAVYVERALSTVAQNSDDENYGWSPSFYSETSASTDNPTQYFWGNSVDGTSLSYAGSDTSSSTWSGEDQTGGVHYDYEPDFRLPEIGASPDLLWELGFDVDPHDYQSVGHTSDSLYLYVTTGVGESYSTEVIPDVVPAYLAGSAPSLGQVGLDIEGTFGFVPSTNGMTAHGLPAEKQATLDILGENKGPTDGDSQTATAPPTSVLVTLAAAGRNPTDILIPTQAGTDGSGDDDEDQAPAPAATGSASAAGEDEPSDDDEVGSHLTREQVTILLAKNYALANIMVADEALSKGASREQFELLLGTPQQAEPPMKRPSPDPNAGVAQAAEVLEAVGKIGTRGLIIGGAVVGLAVNGVEAAGAIALATAPEPTLVTKVGALALGAIAIDGAQSNIRTIFSPGDPKPTVLNHVVTEATGSPFLGASADFVAHTGGSMAAVSRLSKSSGATIRVLGAAEFEAAAVGEELAPKTAPTLSPQVQNYLNGSGGRWGGTATRQLNHAEALKLEGQGYRVTNGAGRGPEEWIRGPGGGTTGGTWVDITATNGAQTIRVQTVTTLADGVTPIASEAAAAARIRAQFPNDTLILVSKQTGNVIP